VTSLDVAIIEKKGEEEVEGEGKKPERGAKNQVEPLVRFGKRRYTSLWGTARTAILYHNRAKGPSKKRGVEIKRRRVIQADDRSDCPKESECHRKHHGWLRATANALLLQRKERKRRETNQPLSQRE